MPSVPGDLTRLGFAEPRRADNLLADPALAPLVKDRSRVETDGLAVTLARVNDPDQALLALVRLMECVATPAHATLREALVPALREPGRARDRLFSVLGASIALGDHLIARPEHWTAVVDAVQLEVEERIDLMTEAVTAPADGTTPEDALRIEYRRQLLGIAALDVSRPDPQARLPETAAALADLAEAALEAALVMARAALGPTADQCRFSVIAMGKTGGRELNYISDVDVIFVAEPADGCDEDAAVAVATELATAIIKICSSQTAAGALWQVDPALRPEGKNGPLVRTLRSHVSYYERWAKTWEFQALLKARPIAGDRVLGRAYVDAVAPFVWSAASRENFVEDVQAMRRRVEDNVPSGEADRQLKLGPGGLRDVEFSVQLLQLVHGRADKSLRSGTTLTALAALTQGGYVGREDAQTLEAAYRLLRTLEHRIQLFRMRRTHLMPTAPSDLRRLGRALGHQRDPEDSVTAQWRAAAREVRRLHQRIFYRPLLSAVARLGPDEVRLAPEAARERLAALGFTDPRGALRHLEALSGGVSRRAAIQRQLLPVMLGWFADEAAPDAGLLAFRRISDELGTTPWFLRLLRDEGSAAERLAHTLGRSRYAADLLEQGPESVQFLGESTGLRPRTRDEVQVRMRAAARRKDGSEAAVLAARAVRRSELFRLAVASLLGHLTLEDLGRALADLSGALIDVTLEVVLEAVEKKTGAPAMSRHLVVGMGRLGGGEAAFGSDADVLFVHDPLEGVDARAAQEQALDVVKELIRLLGLAAPDPRLEVDAGLRPEGKNGPLTRSLDSYRAYYERWSLVWESQALLRAAPVAGDVELGAAFIELINPLRWPEGGIDAGQVREIRTLKARMEAERLPRGADRKTHFKLGHGGLSDVEWCVQLIQLQHAHDHEGLRTTSTLGALTAAQAEGLIASDDAVALAESWRLASQMRNAGLLSRGRPVDSVPSDVRDADGMARIMGLPARSGQELANRYRRVARRARHAAEHVFYGDAT
ncbi:putative glutamate-ammonia-ligase adenylyltransferase [Janibacter sp. HTCC2649]|uniref:bifunctional [glutamine synthetase] adenylyltransferase/[glutamine synthetase]-adenylyl-L-tyrosine phosphorylase n=1 Tax=Janibacter sp. HTCC2649 TaxID=313589 RepID=UPI000066EC2F|nr:bifunctional [glutamine synthetase] adenylyltransferase/[glutamine synthetase]-adenylyl-L-tyrosine phosphorylase [Janibacter sp. HTCC2649]EAP99395.1 putative glutamate-ammonia-ligase adenylyltransferase [Janibacter sp. HTCC2649]